MKNYIISAEALKSLMTPAITATCSGYAWPQEQIDQITNRQINDMIAAGDIIPTIYEKE